MKEAFLKSTKRLYPRKYNDKIKSWLIERYGENEAEQILEKVQENYLYFLSELPDYGGAKNGHASAIYGGLLIFSLYPALPDKPPISELQDFTQSLFMEPFTKLGKHVDLNRPFFIKFINHVFIKVGKRDGKDILKYPDGFINVSEPFDRKHLASRYHFLQCPNAEMAKKYGLLHVLPLLCNCDFYGISQIHGKLIRKGTCGNSSKCDYLIVGNRNPIAFEYETITDDKGFLVSRHMSKDGLDNKSAQETYAKEGILGR